MKSVVDLYVLTNQIQAFLSSDQRILFALSRPTIGRGDFELHIARIEFGRNSFLIFTFPQFDFLTLYCIKLNFGPKFSALKVKNFLCCIDEMRIRIFGE